MKAGTRQRRASVALVSLALLMAALNGPARADMAGIPAGLPSGLPALPSMGEAMQRDVTSGLALRGYDPVAYQLDKRAVAGSPNFEIMQQGVVWRFVSAANREAFRDAPGVYEPAFAGFDASAVADGRAVDTDPRQFAIIGSRLFLFRTPENRRGFVEDASRLIMAESNWDNVSRNLTR